jgi:hypothetical protein
VRSYLTGYDHNAHDDKNAPSPASHGQRSDDDDRSDDGPPGFWIGRCSDKPVIGWITVYIIIKFWVKSKTESNLSGTWLSQLRGRMASAVNKEWSLIPILLYSPGGTPISPRKSFPT